MCVCVGVYPYIRTTTKPFLYTTITTSQGARRTARRWSWARRRGSWP